ncbi:MAG: RluA family pseudouridine synthase [Saprospiraceae bacterium]|jgi:RluA family pseudouridine synthase|nr:RluA family pseudouridine synthase [Saprospiraceae bacterium]
MTRPQVLHDDNYLLAINKPSGLQSDADQHRNLCAEDWVGDYLKRTYPWKKQLRAGLAHRLDRAVSGVLLFGTTQAALKNLLAQFEARTVGKFYLAMLVNCPPEDEGELVHWLRKDDAEKRAVLAKSTTKTAHECRLRYKVLNKSEGKNLVEIALLTGRYHQIRAQMAAIGCPVLGDGKYGGTPIGKRSNESKSAIRTPEMIYLHSHRLVFDHPKTGERMEVSSEPEWL